MKIETFVFRVESRKGPPITVRYGQGPTPVGTGTVFWDEDGALCGFAFGGLSQAVRIAQKKWGLNPEGEPDPERALHILQSLFAKEQVSQEHNLTLRFKATALQHRVWRSLSEIPCGSTWTYQQLAKHVGCAKAFRAVGTAVGQNPISLVLPCHRIVRSDGTLGNYGWGVELKKKLLDWEEAN